MNAGETTVRSILDKPLNQLTEDDISQLTREDCRKYLKEKGMRRPSWNKSQAIQQVISLKALFESSDESGTDALKKVTSNSVESTKLPSDDAAQGSLSVDESSPREKREPRNSIPEDPPCGPDDRAVGSRDQCATNESLGQMTVFYSGKVNVYDGVPRDKAQAIMHLAATPIHLSQENPTGGNSALCHIPCYSQTGGIRDSQFPSCTVSQTMQTEKVIELPQQPWEKENSPRDCDAEGQTIRKVSLQRYLEKRKDRLKSKKSTSLTSPCLGGGYFNHHARTHFSNGNPGFGRMIYPSRPGPPLAIVGTTANQAEISCLPVDLNVKDVNE